MFSGDFASDALSNILFFFVFLCKPTTIMLEVEVIFEELLNIFEAKNMNAVLKKSEVVLAIYITFPVTFM